MVKPLKHNGVCLQYACYDAELARGPDGCLDRVSLRPGANAHTEPFCFAPVNHTGCQADKIVFLPMCAHVVDFAMQRMVLRLPFAEGANLDNAPIHLNARQCIFSEP